MIYNPGLFSSGFFARIYKREKLMSVLQDVLKGMTSAAEQYEAIMAEVNEVSAAPEETRAKAWGFGVVEKHYYNDETTDCSLVCADNVEYMKWLLANGRRESIRLIYIDPPFFTKANYNATVSVRDAEGRKKSVHHLAYNDMFERNLEFYIENMAVRLMLMKELLHPEGTIWVHLDWHSSHYVKLLMDEIFGEKHLVNEIIWKYKSGGSGKKHFARKHDTILVYAKGSKYYLDVPKEKSYNRGLKPYHFKGVEEYKDEYGWYTLVNMKDVWSIDMVGRTSGERTGYATQKPLELMKRIICAATAPGDMCADFFCGSGSFLEAAKLCGREWIGCDNEQLAASMARKRLDSIESDYSYISNRDELRRVGRVVIDIKGRDELENGKSLFFCGISSIDLDLDIGHVPLKERSMVNAAAAGGSFGFIDYVMIDPEYRGEFSAEIIITRDFDDMRFISSGDAAMVVVDVFGREYFVRV